MSQKRKEPRCGANHDTNEENEVDEYNDEEKDKKDAKIEERTGNLLWCHCSKCSVETREIDCLSYQEVFAIIEVKFCGKECITFSDEFKTIFV